MLSIRPCLAELIGTFWLVLGGCGSAIFAASFSNLGIGFFGVSLAFGLTVVTMAYAIGHISGCHLNPAVTVGLCVGGRFPPNQVLSYVISQTVGAIIAGAFLYLVANGMPDFDPGTGMAANGYAELSPGGYTLCSSALIEGVLTAFFLFIIMGVTSPQAPKGFAPLAIGLSLTLIHLISIPITNTSVNPARSTGVALFSDSCFLGQLWMFWLVPLIGGALGALGYKYLEKPMVS